MNDFALYFETGWHHIISWDALDHLLFIAALTATYLAADWKQLLVLVTAFTIGHSLTLALSVYDIIRFNSAWVEIAIPLTIMITSLKNILLPKQRESIRLNYGIALVFGLVHGMGFASTIRFMLAGGQQILTPLLSFNLGLEAGQLLVVAILLLTGYLLVTRLSLPRKWWITVWSLCAFFIALKFAWERIPEVL